jgi:hypothetical protein
MLAKLNDALSLPTTPCLSNLHILFRSTNFAWSK